MKWYFRELLRSSSTLVFCLIFFGRTAIVTANTELEFNMAQQPNPNRERLIQPGLLEDSQEPFNQQLDDSETLTPSEADEPATRINGSTTTIDICEVESTSLPTDKYVQGIEILGITVKSIQQQADQLLLEFRTHREQFDRHFDIICISDLITSLYLEEGYITSFATANRDPSDSGQFTINVTEGSVTVEIINENGRLNDGYIRSRIERGVGTPLNLIDLENHLRLLRTDPRIEAVEPVLRDSGTPGKSILGVTILEAPNYGGQLFVDNNSPPSIGAERTGIQVFHRNLSGIGDQLTAAYDRSIPGASENVQVNYRVPLNGRNGTLDFGALFHDDEIIAEPFDEFDFRGEFERYEISYRQPVIRTLQQEFALSAGFTFQDGQTFTFAGPTPFSIGPDSDGVSRTSVFKFGQDFIRRDRGGAWAVQSQFNFGTGLFDATVNSEPVPDSRFFSWLLQAQRLQVINDRNFIILQADFQITPDSLLPSEQFVIGGGQSVRGFRQNVRAGDNGFRFLAEDRLTLLESVKGEPVFQLAPFINMGAVSNSGDNPNPLLDQQFILGIGTGLIWQPIEGLRARIDYAFPVIDLEDRGDNVQDNGFNFSLSYSLN